MGRSEARRFLLQHVHMAVSLLLLFMAYRYPRHSSIDLIPIHLSSVQNLATSIIPKSLGFWSVATIYASLTFSSLFLGPFLISNLLIHPFILF